MTRYCVIGAGAAGISALEQLLKAGYEVDCFEKSDRIGGHWHTDYDALHLITSRDMTHFEDFPMPAEYPHFPRRDQIRTYLESYARANGHYEIIRFNTAVVSVVPIPSPGPVGSAGWTVTLDSGESIDYDGVLVANGHLWDQKVPTFPGTFIGKQIHSGSYRNTGQIDGERVLVVGAGNSGCDLAVDVAQHRFEADIVVREGTMFQPKTYFGKPRQEVEFLAQFAPEEQDLINRLMGRLSLGEWHNYPGMPEPKYGTLAGGRVVVNDLLLYWIHHGRIRVVPGIERFNGKTVHFTDGTARDYDTILWATGFHASLPFIDDSLISRSRSTPLRYGGGIVPVGLDKLYLIGMCAPRGPQIPVYGIQTKLAIKMIALHEQAGHTGAGIEAYLAAFQEPDDRIDIVRVEWEAQLEDTERILTSWGKLPTRTESAHVALGVKTS
ncbi:NAD(P)-binding domain-containing protein [Paenarthrobacter sp. CM16]|uniref:flavin-containing monooxygenase n=1 Tax=Paenarthrobacter sp. CM16 TaxID=2738447 RepID=UPI001551C9CC|nr:NAD(P)-binding domain-containing protein [Paenarthrobacter sp. CM16]NQD87793.1 NAD(P)-binding domain-containing protein [Paenarthrobacter sp. CM16]